MFHLIASSLTAALVVASVPASAAETHGATCLADGQPARISHMVAPETPAIAKLQSLSGTTVVRVDISNAGSVLRTAVARSSGSAMLDRAALAAARAQAYTPEIEACRPVAGSYALEVEFAE
jgi:protein TonB